MAQDANRWTQAAIDAAEARVRAEVAASTDPGEFLETRIAQLAEDLSPPACLLRFVYVLSSLRRAVAQGKGGDVNALLEVGHALLKLEGITSTSTLSHLLAELHVLDAARLDGAGRLEAAVWQVLTAERQAQRSRQEAYEMRRLLAQAQFRLRLGHTSFAIEALRVVEEFDDPELKAQAMLWRVRALRISGDARSAELAIGLGLKQKSVAEGFKALLAWEAAALEAMATGDLDRLLRAAPKDGPCHTVDHLVTLSLWTKAVKSRSYLEKTVKSRTLRRTFPGEVKRHSASHAALSALETLENAYDNTIPLDVRLQALGKLHEDRKKLQSVEWELLLLAASARCLARLSQDAMAGLFTADYRALSLTLSLGASGDVLGVMSDLLDKPWFRESASADGPEGIPDPEEFSIRRSAFSVGIEASKLSAKLGQAAVSTRFRKILASKEERHRLDELHKERIAEALTSFMGELKGGVMKIGQMLSWASLPVPEQYQAIFGRLQASANPIPHQVMRAMFKQEIGRFPEDCFAEWEPLPVAVASVSQVYRARLKDGRAVAVKILFPGVEAQVRDAFRRLRRLRPLLQAHIPATDLKPLEDELERHIAGECDLRLEAANQREFAELTKDLPGIGLAEIIDEFSTHRVLTTTFIEGMRLERFLEEATPEERSEAGNIIGRASLHCFLEHGVLNVDPNPANFLFQKGKVYFLDFGCVKRWPSDFMQKWLAVISTALDEDLAGHTEAVLKTKGVADVERFDFETSLRETREIFAPLLLTDNFEFTQEFLDERFAALKSKNLAAINLDPQLVLAYRALFGLIAIGAKLRARASWGKYCLPYFKSGRAA